MPLGVSTGSLSPLSPEELAAAGIKASDFGPANWKAAQGPDGKQYAVPLDIHSIILYYNKDLLKKAGLLGDDGKPKGLDGVANWDAALAKLTANGVSGLVGARTTAASGWRIFYTLLNQQGGQFLKDGKFLDGDNLAKATTALAEMQKWVEERLGADQHRISGLDRPLHLRQGGDAHQRRLGSADDGRPRQEGQAVRLGRDPDPGHLRPRRRPGRIPIPSPSRTARATRSTRPSASSCSTRSTGSTQHSLEWAGGGHIPAYPAGAGERGVQGAEAELGLCRRSPRPPCSIRSRCCAGVASPVYDAAGNYVDPGAERRDRAGRRRQEDARRSAEPDQIGSSVRSRSLRPPTIGRGRSRSASSERRIDAMLRSRRSEYLTAAVLMAPFVVIYGVLFVYPTMKMVGARLHQRAADRPGRVGRLRQLLAALLGPAVLDRRLEHLLLRRPLASSRAPLLGLVVALGGQPPEGLAAEPRARGVLPALHPAGVGRLPHLELDVRQGFRRRADTSSRRSTSGQHVSVFRTIPLFMPAVAFVTVWWCLGFSVLLFIAGLRNISTRDLRGGGDSTARAAGRSSAASHGRSSGR